MTDTIADQPRSVGSAPYLPFVEGMRGLLALYVALYHVYCTSGGIFALADAGNYRWWLGWTLSGPAAVVAFIFISGLCLGLPAVRNREAHGNPLHRGTLNFYRARARRILPAYYASLFSCAAVASGLTPAFPAVPMDYHFPVLQRSFIGSLLLVPNLFPHNNGVGVIWSLGVEIQIYLLFPLMCVVWKRFGLAALFCATVFLATCAERRLPLALGPARLGGVATHGLFPSYYVVFVTGLIAAAIVNGHSNLARVLRDEVPWGKLLLLDCGLAYFNGLFWPAVAEFYEYRIAAWMLVLVLTVHQQGWLRRLFEWRPFLLLGSISYSFYLLHLTVLSFTYLLIYRVIWPMKDENDFGRATLFQLLIAIPAALVISALFARLVEWPFMKRLRLRADLGMEKNVSRIAAT